jgi:hypothetical protein
VSRQAFNAPDSDQAYIRWIKQSGVDFNGIVVDPGVPKIINEFHPDEIVKLQELLTEPANPDQRKFLDHWISIQPKKAQHLMQL